MLLFGEKLRNLFEIGLGLLAIFSVRSGRINPLPITVSPAATKLLQLAVKVCDWRYPMQEAATVFHEQATIIRKPSQDCLAIPVIFSIPIVFNRELLNVPLGNGLNFYQA